MDLPLHELKGGNVAKCAKTTWALVHELAFLQLKEALSSALVLVKLGMAKPYIIKTASGDYAVGAVLLQRGEDGKKHPVAFESCKSNTAQRNYPAQEH